MTSSSKIFFLSFVTWNFVEELLEQTVKYISAYRHPLFYKVDCNAHPVPTLIHSSKALELQFSLLSVMLRLKAGISNSKTFGTDRKRKFV